MNRALEELVWRRAQDRCEYCQIPQEYDGFTHEIDHTIAKKHRGLTTAKNLALACFPCNNHKGTDLSAIDPLTRKLVRLFNPRRHKWAKHFQWEGPRMVGKTAIGRATIELLKMNDSARVQLRQELIEEGVFPHVVA